MSRFLIGVDEAGRGPLAGPVAVGVVMVRADVDIKKHFRGVADSKVLSETVREEIYERLKIFAAEEMLSFAVVFSSAHIIDSKGITYAVRSAVYKGVRSLAPQHTGVTVLLDGLLHAPAEYAQQTIIRGDASEPIISLASIAAKVRRDRLMRQLSRKHPAYGFEQHKGYGTRQHLAAIDEFGLCEIHRRTFCKAAEQG